MKKGLFPIFCSFEESSDDKYYNPIEVMGTLIQEGFELPEAYIAFCERVLLS
ncbi:MULTISPECIES: hypothetical protein [Lysinibacillus]|uniref:hypothetical protein n=1 Tax=Lysinibacillus TaxID=400634 RepID=UPI001586374A|nr:MULTISPECIES: hypothetical protein [Lysinibacillus]